MEPTTPVDTNRADEIIRPQGGQPDPRMAGKPRAAPLSRTQEYVSAGSLFARLIRGLFALNGQLDDAEREYGALLYESMMNDPACGSSVDVLRQGAIREIRIVPPRYLQVAPGDTPTPEQIKAQEIADRCMRAIHAPDRPLVEILYEFTFGLVQDKLAEIIYRTVNDGPDKGYYTFDRFKFKRRESWKYVVDAFGNTPFIAGILPPGEIPPSGYDSTFVVPGTGGNSVLMDRERFAIFSWSQRDSDPRCRPILRRAYNAWNLKVRTWPEKLKGDVQFGTPTLLGEVAENAMDPEPDEVAGLTNADGSPVTTAEDLLAYVLTQVSNGTAAAVPHGTKVQVIESQKDGASINASIELYNREIAMAILHAPRATQEAMHGSKADAQTATDVTQGLKDLIACLLAGMIRNQWLKPLIRLNDGPEAAEYMLPEVMNGELKSGDLPGLLTGMSAWVNTGILTPSQLPAIDAALGLPIRETDELTIREAEAQFQAEQARQAMEEKEDAKDTQESEADEKTEFKPIPSNDPASTKKPLPEKTRPRKV